MLEYTKRVLNIVLIAVIILLIFIFVDKLIIRPGREISGMEKQADITEIASPDENGILAVDENEYNDMSLHMEINVDINNNPESQLFSRQSNETEGTYLMAEDRQNLDPASKDASNANGSNNDAGNNSTANQGDDLDSTDANPEENIGSDSNGSQQNNGPTEETIDYNDIAGFRVEVDLEKQRVFVYYKDSLIREMICSGGKPESPTPLGEYKTSQKIEYAWVDKFDMGAYYWVRFFEDYLFHSVPFDSEGKMIEEEFEKLGNPGSHGCIRLPLEEAKWFYETIPLGAKVLIFE